jgi:hypothetical protein
MTGASDQAQLSVRAVDGGGELAGGLSGWTWRRRPQTPRHLVTPCAGRRRSPRPGDHRRCESRPAPALEHHVAGLRRDPAIRRVRVTPRTWTCRVACSTTAKQYGRANMTVSVPKIHILLLLRHQFGKSPARVGHGQGRPPLGPALRELVLRLAVENPLARLYCFQRWWSTRPAESMYSVSPSTRPPPRSPNSPATCYLLRRWRHDVRRARCDRS